MIKIGEGQIFHSRQTEAKRKFTYKTFFLHFNVDEEKTLHSLLRLKFFNLLTFNSSDYLEGKNQPLALSVREFLKNRLEYEADEIWLQTMPRMFGYVFNPVNFWILKKSGSVDAVLCEVNNTFGERHFYWVRSNDLFINNWHRAEKVFHVSPFQPTNGTYYFRFLFLEDKSSIDIHYRGIENELRLVTWVKGDLAPAESKSAIGLILRYGWMTPLVVARIHYQALILFLKKVQYVPKPIPPQEEVSK